MANHLTWAAALTVAIGYLHLSQGEDGKQSPSTNAPCRVVQGLDVKITELF